MIEWGFQQCQCLKSSQYSFIRVFNGESGTSPIFIILRGICWLSMANEMLKVFFVFNNKATRMSGLLQVGKENEKSLLAMIKERTKQK